MEAAHIPWRPLGRLLVEQGLLTAEQLELALAKQEETGRLLGQTIVECGFVSGPELSSALAAQYGIELAAETGFGTGLRTEIQRRHETERRKLLHAVPDVVDPPEPEAEPAEGDAQSEDEASVHAQLEKQWAKLAAAEDRLAESERALARRRRQVVRFVGRVRERDEHVARLRDELAAAAVVEHPSHFAQEAPPPPPAEHVVFVQLAGGYGLVERDGPPPARNTVVELPELCDRALIVSALGRSPLPDDARPCVFVYPA